MSVLGLFLFGTWRAEDCEISFTMYGNIMAQPIRGQGAAATRESGHSQASVWQSDAMQPMSDT